MWHIEQYSSSVKTGPGSTINLRAVVIRELRNTGGPKRPNNACRVERHSQPTRRFRVAMFNLYQSINKKEEQEKESDVIGHERFYQARSTSRSCRKKKRVTRRTHSAGEFFLFGALGRHEESSSSEKSTEDGGRTPQMVDSLAKAFFGSRRYH
ncbi:hypothetical protein NQ318_022374 [Aromia moschata]|uniref:Uncharacterized protein n=1 Tax=Aromia moschata TaxID=1265417 RepID=A0AAV8Z6T3_9CUCU|nr:hypothetical protein NQ318_022374 [Aromia moschata]